ncbi:Retrovirus-related Pol polyprotein from transposon gypsy, partial [Mucuna pruriens]
MSKIWTCTECASRISKLPTAEFAISSTTFPTAAAIEMPPQGNSPSLEDLMKRLAASNLEFQQSIQQLSLTNSFKFERNVSAVTWRSGKELSQLALQLPRSTEADSKPDANSQVQQQEKTIPLTFLTRTILTRKLESNEELLKMFCKVEINIPLLDAIKQILKYAKFLRELCVHKRKKMKGSVQVGGIVSALTRNEDFTVGAQSLPKKCRDPGIFSVPCTIGECTFANAILDLGASINVMPTSIYKSLNFGDLEPIGMTIYVVQPLGVLEDVLVQVNELIFLVDFYVLDMEGKTSGKGSTLILGRPFLMTAKTKIDVHVGTLSMEFGDTLVQFNIFEAMKHPTEDHSIFGIDLIDELVEECFQLDNHSEDIYNFIERTDLIVPSSTQVGQPDPKASHDNSSSPPPPMELNPLPKHLKYAYLDTEQQLLVIIANNLHQEQEDKLLKVLTQHKKEIGWTLSDLPRINPSICMHRILMEEVAKPLRQQQRRMNPTILDVVKKEVTKLLVAGIIYPSRIANGAKEVWDECHEKPTFRATRKDHFPLPFIDQVLEKLSRKSHYCFWDGFSSYMKIYIAIEDQHKTTFTCPFGTFAYTRMPFGMCNELRTFQRCMTNIFSNPL